LSRETRNAAFRISSVADQACIERAGDATRRGGDPETMFEQRSATERGLGARASMSGTYANGEEKQAETFDELIPS